MDFIKVSPDGWNFEEATSGKRFIPFGSNFVFNYYTEKGKPEHEWSLGILVEPVFRRDIVEKVFASAAHMHMNIMKVFLPINLTLPDPQGGDRARIADMHPSLFERLDYVFDLAEKYGIYLSLTLAEWGGGTLQWFHDGGEFFGSASKDAAVDSYRILADFWKQIAMYAKDRPQLFSYNLAVEFYIPDGNWGAQKSSNGNEWYMFSERYAHDAFRAFLKTKYVEVGKLNQAHEESYNSFDEVKAPPVITWDKQAGCYNISRQVVIDYNEMKEAVTYFFFKNCVDAIRSVDTRHMVTAGLHPDQVGMAPKGFGYKIAGLNNREYDIFDYVTVHLYTNLAYLIDRPSLPTEGYGTAEAHCTSKEELIKRRRECLLYARFIHSGRPLMLEEFGHHVVDEEESYTETYNLLHELIGHVSGFMLWSLGDHPIMEKYIPSMMDLNLDVNEWGEKWKRLFEPGGEVYELPTERAPANATIRLNYEDAYAPVEETAGEKILHHWDLYSHPVDFELEGNRGLALYKERNKSTIWN